MDARARLMWLMRVSRIASPEGGTGLQFAQQLTEAGFSTSPSGLSRRENGARQIQQGLPAAYEQILGVPAGRLGACEVLLRELDRDGLLSPPAGVGRRSCQQLLTDLEEAIEAGTATGAAWLRAAGLLTGPDSPVLPPSVLGSWARTLLRQMLHATGDEYLTRYAALVQLIGDPVTRPLVRGAVAAHAGTAGAPRLDDALRVLAHTGDPDTVDQLTRWLLHGSATLRLAAARSLLHRVVAGAITAAQATRLQRAIVQAVRSDPDDAGDAALLLAERISPRLAATVTSALGTAPTRRDPGTRIEDPAGLRIYLRAAARASGVGHDQMLQRLLQEALSDDYPARSDTATCLLAASPYRPALAGAALALVVDGSDHAAADRAALLLPRLAGPEHHADLIRLTGHPDPAVRAAAITALPAAGGVTAAVDLPALAADPACTSAAIDAGGLSEHPQLAALAQAAGLDRAARDTARWWELTGGRITDPLMDRVPAGSPGPDRDPAERVRPDWDVDPAPALVMSAEPAHCRPEYPTARSAAPRGCQEHPSVRVRVG